jgi:acetyl esterase/lipase
VFIPPKEGDKRLGPLHLDMHGGAFIRDLAEYNARRCAKLSDETGAVVVSSMYRYAPKHTFPAAIDGIDDVVGYLFKNAEVKFGANPELFTVGGSSAGGNLTLAACQQPACQYPSKTAARASVAFYAPVGIFP